MFKAFKIAISGASGFVGSSLTARLLKQQRNIVALSRRPLNLAGNQIQTTLVDGIEELHSASDFLYGCDAVVHLAAKVHSEGVSLLEFRRINSEATLTLAQAAANAGVKRFIFVSSVVVNGITNTGYICSKDEFAQSDGYAISKFEAELGLRRIASETNLEVVIIRSPLVYGANAPANFGKLMKLALKNMPLPLGAIHNKRSLVSLDNLVDLIVTCIDHPKAANQTFLVSDGRDVSTTELLQMMTSAAGKKPRLIPIPISWLKLAGKLTGKQAVIDRLCGNLQVDISHTKDTLGWKPPITVEEGIARCFASKG